MEFGIMKTIDLKPCPNCGSNDLSCHYTHVKCKKCSMIGPQTTIFNVNDRMDEIITIATWNNLPRKSNIVIIEDSHSDMLRISVDGKCLFEGNTWDFNRDGKTFRDFFLAIGIGDVTLMDKEYDKWYEE